MPTRASLAIGAAGAVLIAALSGCGSNDSSGDSGDSSSHRVYSLDGDSPTAGGRTRDQGSKDRPDEPAVDDVKLVDAGAAPRRILRLHPTAGDREQSTVTMDNQTTGTGVDVRLPAMEIMQTVEVISADADRIVARQVVDSVRAIDAAGVDPAALAAVEASSQQMSGITFEVTADSRGHVLDTDIDTSGVDPSLASLVEQMGSQAGGIAMRLPAEEVGVGAVWRTAGSLTINGAHVEQITEYTLTSLDGDAYELALNVEQRYLPGEFQGGRITGGSGTASGTSSGLLSALTPLSTRMDGSSSFTIEAAGQSVTLRAITKQAMRTEIH